VPDTYWMAVRPTSGTTAEDLIDDLRALLGAQVTASSTHDGEYQVAAPGRHFFLDTTWGHDDEGDPDDTLPYGYFPWHLSVDDFRDPEASERVRQSVFGLYEALVGTNKYECLLFWVSSDELLATNAARTTRPETTPPDE
jgi:hypothetical protein